MAEVSHVVAEWAFTLGLKKLREDSDNSNQSDIARRIGKTRATIGHYEMGRYLPSHDSLDIMLDAYGHAERAGYYRDLRDRVENHVPDWWEDRFPDGFPPHSLALLAGLEASAARIHVYEPHAVPELLRTAAYAEHMLRAGSPTHSDEYITARLRMLEGRQEALRRRAAAADVRCVLDEAVLHRMVGGTEVLREQLSHLADLAREPHIEIRVLTPDQGFPAGGAGGFTELMLPADLVQDFNEVAYVATPVDRLHYESPNELSAFHALWENAYEHALSAGDSLDLLTEHARHPSPRSG